MPMALAMSPLLEFWRSTGVAADIGVAPYQGALALASRRTRRLAALLSAAARASPLYRELMKGNDPTRIPLADLPIARKPELMRRFDEWVCDPALSLAALRRHTAEPARIGEPFGGRYVIWESSGSSGEPCVFVQDDAGMAVQDALEACRRPALRPWQRMLDPWLLGERIVFVGATGGHFASTVSIERLRRLNPAWAERIRSVSFLQPAARVVAELRALAPTIVATYPSAALLLAEEQRAGRLDLSLREIWTGGETLTPPVRRFVREAFGCPIASSYGASEFLSLASECHLGQLHLNSDWAILEPVDERGRAVPPGEAPATTLLTNLANHVQPLIRFDLGDRVTVHSRACDCGSCLPVIEVEGRCDDALCMPRANGSTARLLPLALTTVLEEEAGLFDFQLVQSGPGELLLRTGLGGPPGREAVQRGRTALMAFLAREGVTSVRFQCREGDPARVGASGKILRVMRELKARQAETRPTTARRVKTSRRPSARAASGPGTGAAG